MDEGLRDVKGAHKNVIAVMRVSVPVMIMSLENGECIGEMLGLILPLPWLKSCGVYVQYSKADETNDNLSCSVYEYLRDQRDMTLKPIPFIKTVGG
jgi:hypothetical protein